jgi:hypothetical protein
LSNCSTWDRPTRIEVQTIEVERQIPIQNRAVRLELNNIKWFVVTEQNFEEFKEKYIKQNGEFLFFAISVRDYETLALNMADIKRYIKQQKQIIIYYEKALSPKEEEKEK